MNGLCLQARVRHAGFCPRERLVDGRLAAKSACLMGVYAREVRLATKTVFHWTSGFVQEREPPSLRGGKLGKGVGKQTTPFPKFKRFRLSASFRKGLRLCPTIFLKLQGCPRFKNNSDISYRRRRPIVRQPDFPHLRGARFSGLP